MNNPQKQSKFVSALTWIIIILMFGYLYSQFANTSSKSTDLQLLDYGVMRGEYGSIYIIGRVRNNSNRTFSYAQISFRLFDKNGNHIGTAMDNITNLEPKSIWKFKALILNEEATKFQFAELTGW